MLGLVLLLHPFSAGRRCFRGLWLFPAPARRFVGSIQGDRGGGRGEGRDVAGERQQEPGGVLDSDELRQLQAQRGSCVGRSPSTLRIAKCSPPRDTPLVNWG